MHPRRTRRPHPGQILLFAPAAILAVLGLTAVRNGLARPVVTAQDSPDGGREAVIYLKHSPLYPIAGTVQAVLAVRRLPGREPITERSLGLHRWASEAGKAYRSIEWPETGKLVLRSADPARSRIINLGRERPAERSANAGAWALEAE